LRVHDLLPITASRSWADLTLQLAVQLGRWPVRLRSMGFKCSRAIRTRLWRMTGLRLISGTLRPTWELTISWHDRSRPWLVDLLTFWSVTAFSRMAGRPPRLQPALPIGGFS